MAKDLWASFPINCLNFQKRQIRRKEKHPKFFDAIKCVIGCEVLLAYLDFNATFEIYTDASKIKIGAVIPQKVNPIAFYSRKMNSAQQNYTTTEKELIYIVAYLKEFYNIILGHQITVYTDHKNLTYKILIQNA